MKYFIYFSASILITVCFNFHNLCYANSEESRFPVSSELILLSKTDNSNIRNKDNKQDEQNISAIPVISNLTYDSISQTSVTLYWATGTPADSKIRWMAPDSNYQPVIFTDSVYVSDEVINHSVKLSNLRPATIYKYYIESRNSEITASDSGYFVTQSASSGKVNVYFNHTVDTSVATGAKAKGKQDFAGILAGHINNAKYSIDITLWEFNDIDTVCKALINAFKRGVKIRFLYTHSINTPLIDSLINYGIPVLKRNSDTTHSMHNKFWIFDYRLNSDAQIKYLWTGSTNITHPQLHSDRNNVIVIQDESLCAVYTREFEEMWGSHTDQPDPVRARFGAMKVDNVPHILNVAGTRMEVYFSPSDSVTANVTRVISNYTTKSLYFCMLKFNLHPIETTLHFIFGDGKKVYGVFDSANSTQKDCAYPRMKGMPVANSWIPPASVYLDTIDGLIHHKYFILDASIAGGSKITGTGSYNWEVDAEYYNDENELIIFNPEVNNLYYQEFNARLRESGGMLSDFIENNGEQPELNLGQSYPNPSFSGIFITFGNENEERVKIVIYDNSGRLVKVLIDDLYPAGIHLIYWDGKDNNGNSVNSGTYYYTLNVNGRTETKKVIITR